MMTRQQLSATAAVVGVILLLGPPVAGQVSVSDASAVREFIGTWAISLESPSGDTFDQTLAIWEEDGKVASFYDGPLWVPVDRGRGVPIITDVSRDGDNLVLTLGRRGKGGPAIWTRDGRSILYTNGVILTLTLDGEMLNVIEEFSGGQMRLSGSGKKP